MSHDDAERQLYLDSFYHFAKYCLGYKDMVPHVHGHICRGLQEPTLRKLICIPRGTFKCVTRDVKCYTSTGMSKSIIDVQVGEEIMSWDDGHMVMASVVAKDIKFNQPTFKFKMRSGREIETSGNHPFLQITGWTMADQLKVGDRVAGWAGKIMDHGVEAPSGHPWLLGMMIGDGSCTGGNASISMFHDNLINETKLAVQKCGFQMNQKRKGKFALSDGIRPFMSLYNIKDKSSWTKSIPDQVWGWSLKDRREFVAAYLSCDAHATKDGKLTLTSVSKDLAYGMLDLLKTIGALGVIRYREYGEIKFYEIRVMDNISQRNLMLCPLRLKKRSLIESPLACIYRCVPKEWRKVKKPYQPRNRKGTPRIDNNYATSFDKFKKITDQVGMEWACSDEVYWDSILSIERSTGEHIDIEVEGTHTFLANGLIVHNSSIASVAYPMWKLIHNPNLRIMIDSQLYTNSSTFLREIKGHYERNEKFKHFFGNWVGPVWSEGEIIVKPRTVIKKEPSIACSGIGVQKTSQHFDVCLADDLSSYDNCKTREHAEKVWNHYRLYTSILDPGGEIVVIGTRYSELDIIGFIIENELGVKDGDLKVFLKLLNDFQTEGR